MRMIPIFCLIAVTASAFEGQLTYSQTASGGGQSKLFKAMAAETVRVAMSDTGGYRQDEIGGAHPGSYLARPRKAPGLKLNHREETSELIGVTCLDDLEPKVREFMPWHFKSEMKSTGKKEKILGHDCEVFEVTRSGFLRAGARARLWITKDLDQGLRRHDFQSRNGATRVISPLPLSFPIEAGATLKVEVIEGETTVTVVATRIVLEKPDDALFEKPADYEGPDFPKDPVARIRPKRKKVDVFKLPATLENGVGMTLVLVKPSTFKMGSPEDEPKRRTTEIQHEVTLEHPYYIGATEVTQGQWKEVMGADSPSHFKGENLPVEKVTWEEAKEFCARLSQKEGRIYRLPTEAEWECAARAGQEVDFKSMKYPELKAWITERAWMSWNSEYKSHEAGRLKANAWGIYDMLGNVAEWTDGGLRDYSADPVVDPQGTESQRIGIRGSGWVSGYDFIRFAYRDQQDADKRKSTIGFRVVCEP
jgi:formylglycine-generating enzyme required for sulfatase activity